MAEGCISYMLLKYVIAKHPLTRVHQPPSLADQQGLSGECWAQGALRDSVTSLRTLLLSCAPDMAEKSHQSCPGSLGWEWVLPAKIP